MAKPLYGPDGREIQPSQLARPIQVGDASPWADTTTVSGMTPARLGAVLRDPDSTAFHDFAAEMEASDDHLLSILGVRRRAVSSLKPVIEAASDDARDVRIADAVRAMLKGLPWSSMVEDAMDGIWQGFSVQELLWDPRETTWALKGTQWWAPGRFQWGKDRIRSGVMPRDSAEARELRRRAGLGGEIASLEPGRWLVHVPHLRTGAPGRTGLARTIAWSYLAARYSFADWMQFLAAYGAPIRIGRYGRDASKEDRLRLVRAIRDLAATAGIVIPEGMDLEFADAARGNRPVFEPAIKHLQAGQTKAVLGQLMATEQGSSRAQAEVQDRVRQDIRTTDAEQVRATFQEQLINVWVAVNFGVPEQWPLLQIPVPDLDARALLAAALKDLVPLGLRVDGAWVRSRMGMPDPGEDAELLGPPAAPQPGTARARRHGLARAGNDRDGIDDMEDEALGDWEEQLEPVLDPVREALANASSYDEFASALRRVRKRMGSDALAEALARATFTARAAGDAEDRP